MAGRYDLKGSAARKTKKYSILEGSGAREEVNIICGVL